MCSSEFYLYLSKSSSSFDKFRKICVGEFDKRPRASIFSEVLEDIDYAIRQTESYTINHFQEGPIFSFQGSNQLAMLPKGKGDSRCLDYVKEHGTVVNPAELNDELITIYFSTSLLLSFRNRERNHNLHPQVTERRWCSASVMKDMGEITLRSRQKQAFSPFVHRIRTPATLRLRRSISPIRTVSE
jgi:hypothetical protein